MRQRPDRHDSFSRQNCTSETQRHSEEHAEEFLEKQEKSTVLFPLKSLCNCLSVLLCLGASVVRLRLSIPQSPAGQVQEDSFQVRFVRFDRRRLDAQFGKDRRQVQQRLGTSRADNTKS